MHWRLIGLMFCLQIKCSYIFGNPPFGGAKPQSDKQRKQVHRIAGLGKSGGTLDYCGGMVPPSWGVCAPSKKEPDGKMPPRIGFVATNSITQGEQVAQLWPLLFNRYNLEISFAHQTFEWSSNAPKKAHVHVVIIGLDADEYAVQNRELFVYKDIKGEPEKIAHKVITPYLFGGDSLNSSRVVVHEEGRPINGMPQMRIGSKPIDGGHYIFKDEESVRFY